MNAAVRFGGKDACVDNLHSGGVACEVDPTTGYIVGSGYNIIDERFNFHPVSHTLLPGIQIPNWEKVLQAVKNAALRVPNMRHVGWDIAVSTDSICFIEANEQPNFDIIQMTHRRGVKEQYLAYMRKKS